MMKFIRREREGGDDMGLGTGCEGKRKDGKLLQ